MLTVFGSKGGADTYWCGFKISGFNTNGVSSAMSNFVGPLPFRLPPSNGRIYYISDGGFGLAGEEIPIGYLESDDSPVRVPKPCQHLNATGSLMLKPTGGFPSFGKGIYANFNSTSSYLSPSTTGPKVSQFYGHPTPKGAYYYWKRDGSIAMKSDSSFYTPFYCGYPIGNNPPVGTVPYKYGMRVYYPVTPYTFSTRYVEYMFSPIIVDLNSFKFVGDYADHVLPGDAGTYYNYEASFTMSQIVGNTDGTFQIFGTWNSLTRGYLIDAYGKKLPLQDKVEKTTGWRYLHLISPSNLPPSAVRVTDELDRELREYEVHAKSQYSEDMMKAARSNAIADITALKSNNLENISGLKGSFDIIGSLVQGYKAVVNGNIMEGVKALSGAYLWYSYAAAPTVKDVRDATDNVDQIAQLIRDNPFSNERRRGRVEVPNVPVVGDIQYNVTYHTRLRDNYYAQLYSALQRVGLHPAVSQGWDFIPFSFVIDWFLGIGPVLERLDNYNNMFLTRTIRSRIESFKASKTEDYRISGNPSLYEFLGPYEKSYYQRLIHSGSGDVDPFVGQTSAGVRSSQVMQGASLLIQQLD